MFLAFGEIHELNHQIDDPKSFNFDKHLSSVFQQVEFLGSVGTLAFCWRRSYHYSGNGTDFLFNLPTEVPKMTPGFEHSEINYDQYLHVSTSKSSAPPKLWSINHSRRQRRKPCYGAVRRSCRCSKRHRWGSRVQVVPTQKKVPKGLHTYLKSKHDTIHKTWTRWEKDICSRKTMILWRVSMFLFWGCLIEGWSFFPVSSRPLSLVPFCWTNPSWLWATSKPLLACPKAEDFATIY